MLLKNNGQRFLGLLIAILLLLLFICLSIVYGYTDTTMLISSKMNVLSMGDVAKVLGLRAMKITNNPKYSL